MRKPRQPRVNIFDKFQKSMGNSDLVTSLQDIIIYTNADGTYCLFDQYTITKISPSEYKVSAVNSALDITFNSLKNATAWCIFDKRGKFYETRRISELDSRLGGLEIDIQVHQRLLRKASTSDDQLIYIAKITEDKLKKKLMSEELAGYTNESKAWQTKRYDKR